MKVFFAPSHTQHAPEVELTGGTLIPAHDRPERTELIAAHLRAAGEYHFDPPEDRGMAPIRAVHDMRYLTFLKQAHAGWRAEGLTGNPMASNLPISQAAHCPTCFEGQVGFFANSADTMITPGTWQAAYDSAQSAVAAAAEVAHAQARSAFALCRPPGHHCESARFGGYCYLNNAAIAAQYLRDVGVPRVGVLDIDYHHGNGTQQIFWTRDDVFTASVHGDPALCYPFFHGYASETGTGAGQGYNCNIPLPPGTDDTTWVNAVTRQLNTLVDFGAEAIVLSLGADAHGDDPQSFFSVTTQAYAIVGEILSRAGVPVVVIMEGGYNQSTIAEIVETTLAPLV